MNPAIDPTIIERAYATDEAAASAEWGAQFRYDVESFLTHDLAAESVPGHPADAIGVKHGGELGGDGRGRKGWLDFAQDIQDRDPR